MKKIYNNVLELFELSDVEFEALGSFDKGIYKIEKSILSPLASLGWAKICCVQAYKLLKSAIIENDKFKCFGDVIGSIELSYSCISTCEENSKSILLEIKKNDLSKKEKANGDKAFFSSGIIGEFKKERGKLIHQNPNGPKKTYFGDKIFFGFPSIDVFLKLANKGINAAYSSRLFLSKIEIFSINYEISKELDKVKREKG